MNRGWPVVVRLLVGRGLYVLSADGVDRLMSDGFRVVFCRGVVPFGGGGFRRGIFFWLDEAPPWPLGGEFFACKPSCWMR